MKVAKRMTILEENLLKAAKGWILERRLNYSVRAKHNYVFKRLNRSTNLSQTGNLYLIYIPQAKYRHCETTIVLTGPNSLDFLEKNNFKAFFFQLSTLSCFVTSRFKLNFLWLHDMTIKVRLGIYFS